MRTKTSIKTKPLYISLLSKKYPDPVELIQEISLDPEHIFWLSARDFAKEILPFGKGNWTWLSNRIDDFAFEAEKSMKKKMQKWLFRALLGSGSLAKSICNSENTVSWLLDRYVAELKNLFDPRSKNFLYLNKAETELKRQAIEKMGIEGGDDE